MRRLSSNITFSHGTKLLRTQVHLTPSAVKLVSNKLPLHHTLPNSQYNTSYMEPRPTSLHSSNSTVQHLLQSYNLHFYCVPSMLDTSTSHHRGVMMNLNCGIHHVERVHTEYKAGTSCNAFVELGDNHVLQICMVQFPLYRSIL